jgi:hypothetical protein
VDALCRTLRPGGRVHVATDHQPYFEAIRDILRAEPRWWKSSPSSRRRRSAPTLNCGTLTARPSAAAHSASRPERTRDHTPSNTSGRHHAASTSMTRTLWSWNISTTVALRGARNNVAGEMK